MYQHLETFFGKTARAAWEKFKEKFPNIIAEDLAFGINPHNFTNRVQLIITAQSANRETLDQQ